MARKGTAKVRTGCLTCKVRKVKCDETKPGCQRCIKTGRKCDGYPKPDKGAYTWDELLAVRTVARNPSTSNAGSDMEARALEFFRLEVAPMLSRHSSKHFWTQLAPQVGQQETFIRHALVSISSLYESMADRDDHNLLDSSRGQFAINQYNMALKQLTSKPPDESMVVFVCLLFICIESLQGNKKAAIAHCQHGITMLNTSSKCSAWAKHYLIPMFLRLSIFPFFFGKSVDDFPHLINLSPGMSAQGITLDDNHLALDFLLNRAIRCIRSADIYRLEVFPMESMPASFFRDQQDIAEALAAWRRRFAEFKKAHTLETAELAEYLGLEVKSLVAKIWLACCLDLTEMEFDEHLADFQEIMDLARHLVLLRIPVSADKTTNPRFIFEMGFLPLLYFVVIKCRALHIRLAALQFMMLLACDRESLWDVKVMYAVGRRVIETEHGISLDVTTLDDFLACDVLMPPGEARIRDSMILENVEFRLNEGGKKAAYRDVCFLSAAPGGGVTGVHEWVKIRSDLRDVRAGLKSDVVFTAATMPFSTKDLEALEWPLSYTEILQAS